MDHKTDWLPSGLEPVAFRLARADQIAYEIGPLMMSWSQQALDLAQIETAPGTAELTVMGIRPIPPQISLLFSEAIHQLRAAVENTLFHLVEQERGAPLTEQEATRVEMPVRDDAASFLKWQKDRVGKVPELGPGTKLGNRIESLQPYTDVKATIPSLSSQLEYLSRVPAEHEHAMTLLQRYSNLDKHRLLRIAAGRAIVQQSDVPFWSSNRKLRSIEIGEVLATGRLGDPVAVDVHPVVALQRPDSDVWIAPLAEFDGIYWHISNLVIPTLIKGFIPTTPALPTEIDLSDTGLDPTERIRAGGWETAHSRMQQVALASYQDDGAQDLRPLRVIRYTESSNQG